MALRGGRRRGRGGEEEGKGSGGEEGGELTCPTQGATLQPSRAEDTVQARTLCNRVLQKVCKPVKFLCFWAADKTVKEENLRRGKRLQDSNGEFLKNSNSADCSNCKSLWFGSKQ